MTGPDRGFSSLPGLRCLPQRFCPMVGEIETPLMDCDLCGPSGGGADAIGLPFAGVTIETLDFSIALTGNQEIACVPGHAGGAQQVPAVPFGDIDPGFHFSGLGIIAQHAAHLSRQTGGD